MASYGLLLWGRARQLRPSLAGGTQRIAALGRLPCGHAFGRFVGWASRGNAAVGLQRGANDFLALEHLGS